MTRASLVVLAAGAMLAGCGTYGGDLQTLCATKSADVPSLKLRTDRGRKLVDTLVRSTSKERLTTLAAELQRERIESCPLLREWNAAL